MGALTFILQWVNAVRRWLYGAGILRAARAARPVVAVGNLGFGGSGKTPVVLALAQALVKRGLRVVILSRGYGGSVRDTTLVREDSEAKKVGDEPLLLARKSGAAVVVDPDRVRGAAWAVGALQPDLFLLDDGFSHLQLARDLDWLMVGAHDFDLGAPRRELRRQSQRAQVVASLQALIPVSAALPTPVHLERRVLTANLAGQRVIAAAAIAHPERFTATLKAAGAEVIATRYFRDHAPFPPHTFDNLPPHDLIAITEKDAVKLAHLPPRCVVVETSVVLPEALVDRVAALVKK